MKRIILTNKPLVEAIFELRWELPEVTQGIRKDPHYPILIGGIFEKIKGEYPFHERLPSAAMPDEMAEYIVQHRFRKGQDIWPLIQIGPGIITLNDTEGYVWEDFERRIPKVVDALFETYPDSENLEVNTLLLRYIDAVEFNYEKNSILDFLKDKMKTEVVVPSNLFEDTGVSSSPQSLDLRFSFPSSRPSGEVYIRFARGKNQGQDLLVWETQVRSSGESTPRTQEEIAAWVKLAHQLTDDWFFKLIEGDLLRRFK